MTHAQQLIQRQTLCPPSHQCNYLFNFVIRVKLAILQDSFNMLKTQKLHEAMSGESSEQGNCESVASRVSMPLLIYGSTLNYPFTPKKSTVAYDHEDSSFPFQFRKKFFMKYNRLNLLPCGRTPGTISFHAVKNPVIILYFGSIACRTLGTSSTGNRANILEHG
jgi:hypothetical protein